MKHHRQTNAWRRPAGGRPAGRRTGETGRSGARPNLLALFAALMAFAIIQSAALTGGAAQAQTILNISDGQRVGKITVSIGESQTLRVSEPFENIVVGNAEIADVAPLTDQSMYLLGRTIGTTNMALYDAESELIAVVDVEVTFNVSGMREAIAAALPGQPIQIRTVGGRVMLQGAVLDAVMVNRAMQIARDFAGEEGVTNALTVASPQQVTLEVRILEAERTLGRDLGVNWSVVDGGFRFSTLPGLGSAPRPGSNLTTGGIPFGALIADFLAGGARVDVLIRALEEKGIARRLAEPNLTALSGQPASFHAGGEFPVPVLQSAAAITDDEEDDEVVRSVEFKQFGVRLSFTPTVLADGVINLIIEPEVSEPNFANAVRGIPSLSTRRAKTTVELRDGQSMAMAGLLQTNHSRNAEQIPWLGDLPILGSLFRSSGYQKNETELVVIVTPRLVKPVPPGMELATPLDSRKPSNDFELVLLGDLEVTEEHLHLIETGGNVRGPFGHMLDFPKAKQHVITK